MSSLGLNTLSILINLTLAAAPLLLAALGGISSERAGVMLQGNQRL